MTSVFVSAYDESITALHGECMTVTTTSRLTEKFQATIPLPVRRALKLGKGDQVAFEIRGEVVILRRATPLDVEFARAVSGTLSEWASKADERAYADL